MILLDTFDSDDEASFVIAVLKKNGIAYTEKASDSGKQVYIEESDEARLNEAMKTLD